MRIQWAARTGKSFAKTMLKASGEEWG